MAKVEQMHRYRACQVTKRIVELPICFVPKQIPTKLCSVVVPAILTKLFWQNQKCFPSFTTGLRWLHVVISWYHRSSLLMQTLLLPYPTALVNNQSLYIPVYSLNDQRKNKVRKVLHHCVQSSSQVTTCLQQPYSLFRYRFSHCPSMPGLFVTKYNTPKFNPNPRSISAP